jgi:hypothetical protein
MGEGTCARDEVPIAHQRPASAKHARLPLHGTAPHPAVGHLLPACGEKGNKRTDAVISVVSAVATIGALSPDSTRGGVGGLLPLAPDYPAEPTLSSASILVSLRASVSPDS